jgi:hypothetical protein
MRVYRKVQFLSTRKDSRMKNSRFKALVAALFCLPLSTHAVNISSDGTGEALIYPYYSVRNGNITLISLVNNDTQGKAVRVRFREGRNGVGALDFNLFLSASDVWTAALVADASGAAKLVTNDLSCTNPRFPQGGVTFRNFAYQSDASAVNGLNRTTEGYLEIIEMAAIVPNSATDINVRLPNAGSRICAQLSNNDIAARPNDFDAPRGKLSGSGTLVSSLSMSTGYNAIALQGLDLPTLVTASGDSLPDLSSGRSKTAVINEATPKRTYAMFAEFDRSIDAVSAVLVQNSIGGEFSREPGIATDFVMTFPSKYLYVNGDTTSPFTSRWDRVTAQACEVPGVGFATREGVTFDGTSSGPPNTKLCFSTTTMSVSLSGTSSPLGSALRAPLLPTSTFEPPFFPETGKATLNLGRPNGEPSLQSNANSRVIVTESGVATREISGSIKFFGLPVVGIGISSAQFTNNRDNYNSSYNLIGSRALPE